MIRDPLGYLFKPLVGNLICRNSFGSVAGDFLRSGRHLHTQDSGVDWCIRVTLRSSASGRAQDRAEGDYCGKCAVLHRRSIQLLTRQSGSFIPKSKPRHIPCGGVLFIPQWFGALRRVVEGGG
nr:MAG TPA_asm: hypothetical protein [Caudoviricetes sp.]